MAGYDAGRQAYGPARAYRGLVTPATAAILTNGDASTNSSSFSYISGATAAIVTNGHASTNSRSFSYISGTNGNTYT